jgi:hypothetical protein
MDLENNDFDINLNFREFTKKKRKRKKEEEERENSNSETFIAQYSRVRKIPKQLSLTIQ